MLDICKSGVHFLTEPIKVESGTTLTAENGCRLVGGIAVKPVNRGDGVYICDLPADLAPMVSRGFGRKTCPSHNELFWNGKPMKISQYPADGFLKITGIGEEISNEWKQPCGKLDGGFYYEDDRPKLWQEQEIWVHGYWSWDWSPTREKIASIDKEKGFIRTEPPYGQYSFRVGQRFCFFNILEEVRKPGDYAIDFANKKLYCIPPAGEEENAEVFLSVADFPAFVIDCKKDIVLDGFNVECFRGFGISVKNAENVTIRNCTIHNIGTQAINVSNSTFVTVSQCHIYDTGDGGIVMYGGDRTTLTPANCTVENCHIHNVANWVRTYQPPVTVSGVGFTVKGNIIHDCPHTAILYGGNDISITDNEIYRVVWETGDAGAIYSGRDYTCRGNNVSRNFIHHVGSGIGMGTMGIYNDDCVSGTVMRENVFYRVQRAVFLGGGVDFIVDGNIFVDCYPGVEADGRGQSPSPVWRNMVINILHDRFYNIGGKGVRADKEPYISRYPELAKIHAYYEEKGESRDPIIPPSATITNNIFCEGQKIKYTWNVEGGQFTEIANRELPWNELKQRLTAHQIETIEKDMEDKKQ